MNQILTNDFGIGLMFDEFEWMNELMNEMLDCF